MLTRAQLKKLPPDPVGYTPELQRDCLPETTRAAYQIDFLPAAFPLVEIMLRASEAQNVMEFYLSRRPVGMGKISPVSLAQVLVYVAHDDIIVPYPLLLTLKQLQAYKKIGAMVEYYDAMPWRHLPFARSPYCTYRLYPAQRAEACELARYLREVRPETSK